MLRRAIFFILGLIVFSASVWAGDGFVLRLDVMDQSRDQVLSEVERAHALGATHFNIPLLLCQNNKSSVAVFWCPDFFTYKQGVPPAAPPETYFARIGEFAHQLRARGFTIGFLPMVISRDDDAWRGFFEPTDFEAWGRSYFQRLDELAKLALASGVSDFIMGTELVRIYVAPNPADQSVRTAYWRATYAALKRKLGSRVSVVLVANWDQFEQIPFWDATDAIGLSAYYPLSDGDGSNHEPNTVEKLTEGWRKWRARLLSLARQYQKKLYFSEVGYPSTATAARQPWSYAPAPLDLELQRRTFEAFGNAWGADKVGRNALARFMIWALDVVDNPLQDAGYGVIGKPAADAAAKAFKLRRGARFRWGTKPR